MKRILLSAALAALLILFAACVAFGVTCAWAVEPPRLYVVASRDVVYPGQLFSVTVTQFGDVGPVTFDSGGMDVITDTLALGGTRYIWLRAAGPQRDVRMRAWAAGVEGSAWIRVCCRTAVFPGSRVYFPAFRH